MATMQVQSLIFEKDVFSRAEAVKWAKDHDFSASGVDETENSYRMRQEDPGQFKTMRTIKLTDGVKAVVGKSHPPIETLSPEVVAKALYPGVDPVKLREQITEDNDGFIGGTIRYGSGSSGSEFGSEYDDEGVRRNVDGPLERFSFGDLTFDIDAAKEMCGGVPNDEVEVSDRWSIKINVDRVAAMRSTSDKPVLIAQIPTKDGLKPLLIDGHHRMYKATQEGVDTLPAYILSPEETLFICDTHPDMMTTLTKNLRDMKDGATVKPVGKEGLAAFIADIIRKLQPSGGEVHVPAAGSEDDEDDKGPAKNPNPGQEMSAGAQQTNATNDDAGPTGPDESNKVPKYRDKTMKKVKKSISSFLSTDDIQKGILEQLDLDGAREKIESKSEAQIEIDSCISWTSLACAVFELAADTMDELDRSHLVDWGDDLYHEALEHGALVKDGGNTVAEVQAIIEFFRRQIPGYQSDETEKGAIEFSPDADMRPQQRNTDPAAVAQATLIPVVKADSRKQIVYGVVLEPHTVDAQGDHMSEEDIEETAHKYLEKYRKAGERHKSLIEQAFPVESYIAPCDLHFDGGPYGSSTVTKGSWVLGMKILDPKIWQKVESGEYKAFSVGGFGVRV